MAQRKFQIALVGNPNSGKSSLFNQLTGLQQHIGNFPGVTVEKKAGNIRLPGGGIAELVDLPGTYSLYPKREDEWVAYRVLMGLDRDIQPDLVVLVADASNLKRNLLFCSQIIDLKIPVVMALSMVDIAKRKGINVDLGSLQRELGVPIVPVNARKNKGLNELLKAIETLEKSTTFTTNDFINIHGLAPHAIDAVQGLLPNARHHYQSLHYLINHEHFDLPIELNDKIEVAERENNFNHTATLGAEILQRYRRINHIMQLSVTEPEPLARKLFTDRLDDVLLHRRWGYLIMFAVLLLLFQAVFTLAAYPMDWIDGGMASFTAWVGSQLPDTWWSNMFVNGLLAGIGGIVVFIPQIMILFGLITLLEDTGYMARISFLSDRLMRKAGLNGKSVMPMVSGFACAVPAIMSARSIENKKERLLTILVTPLISCSARLPVFTILIALVIPNTYLLGFISVQGLVMMLLYLSGTLIALLVSVVLKWFIKITDKSYFILELPLYRKPRWQNIGQTMVDKAKIFVTEAGKIIIVISVLLWALSSYGPTDNMKKVNELYAQQKSNPAIDIQAVETAYQAALLENSYAGILGKSIEPVIKPLGYDWKIGIALITSFAAREVFVGTMATLYAVGDDITENDKRLRTKMQAAKFANGQKVYTMATGVSLMIFYLLAMQCMSTLAIVKKETGTWKWPAFQLFYMTALAYVFSFAAYQLLA